MSKREAELLRWWDLNEEKRRLERELRLSEIERELMEIRPPCIPSAFEAAA
jgi:hypothetical protein